MTLFWWPWSGAVEATFLACSTRAAVALATCLAAPSSWSCKEWQPIKTRRGAPGRRPPEAPRLPRPPRRSCTAPRGSPRPPGSRRSAGSAVAAEGEGTHQCRCSRSGHSHRPVVAPPTVGRRMHVVVLWFWSVFPSAYSLTRMFPLSPPRLSPSAVADCIWALPGTLCKRFATKVPKTCL